MERDSKDLPAGRQVLRLNYGAEEITILRTTIGEFCDRPIFTVWRPNKQPTHPHGHAGVTFDAARKLFDKDQSLAGLGVKLGRIPNSKYFLWGIDHDPKRGGLPQGWPESHGYIETSPSGNGFHILGLYEGEPLQAHRAGPIEIYCDGRFFTLTGKTLNGVARIGLLDPLPFYAAAGLPNPQPYGTATLAEVEASKVGASDLTESEVRHLDRVRNITDPDLSRRDYMVIAEVLKFGGTDQEAAHVLCAGFWRPKLRRESYVARTIAKVREEIEKDRQTIQTLNDADSFREESRAIGEGELQQDYHPRMFSLAELLAEAVFITDGAQVTLRSDPRLAWPYSEFVKLTAASEIHSGQKGRPASVASVWLHHPKRNDVHTRTFRAGGKLFCQSPDHVSAINSWREPPRIEPPRDWESRARQFIEHVEYLVPDDDAREFLYDWLAHIEQKPGELPHVHCLMVTETQGIGRNWLGSVLARVWAGNVALDVDLVKLLDGGFNGRLSHKILAVVNELREGGINRYTNAQRFRTFMTDETREINPKYGRQFIEFNSVRWLMFSNHYDALPLDHFDRRAYVIENATIARDEKYYRRLYVLPRDQLFIASVREWLRRRDISGFNPGMRAPETEAKRRVIEASKSEAEKAMDDLVAGWPKDCITAEDLRVQLFGEKASSKDWRSLHHVTERAECKLYPKRIYNKRNEGIRVWILRNPERWLEAQPREVLEEASF